MQEMQLQLQQLQSQGSAETDGCAAVATLGGNKETTTESSVPNGEKVTETCGDGRSAVGGRDCVCFGEHRITCYYCVTGMYCEDSS